MVETELYVPLPDAAHELGLTWGQAWRLVLIGKLPGRKQGARWVVGRAALDHLLTERGAERQREAIGV